MKINPQYFGFLRKKASPIFFTNNFALAQFIRGCGGACLVCVKNPEAYNLRFINQRECWALFTCACELAHAKALGFALLKAGACKVEVLPFPLQSLIEIKEEFA